MGKIIIAGIGPGSTADITPAVIEAVGSADAVVGYKYYFQFITPYLKPTCQCIDTGMKRERERAEQAFALAASGMTVVVISSGDAGIYGMAPLIYEMQRDVKKNLVVNEVIEVNEVIDNSSAADNAVNITSIGNVDNFERSDNFDNSDNFENTKTGRQEDVEIEVLPGISAFQKAAALLGAPVGHDFCVVSLSDLMTPWAVIERRIRAAAVADFVTAVYNPKSNDRYWQLYRLKELFLSERRQATTPVGIVRQAGRPEQEVTITTLADLDPEQVDMFTVIIIGNSQTYVSDGKMITPRGYYRDGKTGREEVREVIEVKKNLEVNEVIDNSSAADNAVNITSIGNVDYFERSDNFDNFERSDNFEKTKKRRVVAASSPGQAIMTESFRTILSELHTINPQFSVAGKDRGWLWALLHAIRTTADFDMAKILYSDEGAVEAIYNKVKDGSLTTIVTDVTMAMSGIRKGALARLGIEAKCYLQKDLSAVAHSSLTRSQAGIRLAVEEHPDALFVFGNAPTALMELCDLIRKGKARPAGIIAAPVGFVHVCESKHMVKTFTNIPKIIVEGRKGGSNIAATLCNAILTFDDAAALNPGRDL